MHHLDDKGFVKTNSTPSGVVTILLSITPDATGDTGLENLRFSLISVTDLTPDVTVNPDSYRDGLKSRRLY
jgi:hypothetical protein